MTREKKTLVAQHLIEGQFPVMWYRTKHAHIVIYGASHELFENSDEAAASFGYAVHHQAECDGRLDHD